MTTSDRWSIVSPYLEEVLDLPAGERRLWLDALRARDAALATEIESLLTEQGAIEHERFLDDPALPPPTPSLVGQTMGAYTIVAPIGEGGMGTVWLATRSDGRFERRAAVKFVRTAIARRGSGRFAREGRILARLSHPRIAQLLDAGVWRDGQPYLILEYVDGEPIDQYCDAHRLDVDARIRLFQEVLDAVAHAHANLIVHRDLKPSNVLVSSDGHVKLLDFGIAKLLDDEGSAAATILTREGESAMTPEYAAPEQLTKGAVTTATDIYALGVLLYVLLTGQHPSAEPSPSPAEMMKAIVETEARRPSEIVGRKDAPAGVVEAKAASRGATPEKLRRVLRGDLDTIVGKALKKQPSDRYASVTALADDLRRWLRHEPIGARPDAAMYRAAKFVRRNRVSVAAATLVVVALTSGLVMVNRERVIANRRFSELQQLSNGVFQLDGAIRNLPGAVNARQRLVTTSLQYLEGLSADVRGDLDLAQHLADGYWRVAHIQGMPTDLNLGDFASADRSLQKADGFVDLVLAARPRDRQALYRAAHIAHDRMILAQSERRDADALILARQAIQRTNAFLDQGDPSEIERASIAANVGNIGLALTNMHRYGEAIEQIQHDLTLTRGLKGDHYLVGGPLSLLANALRLQGDLDGALRAIEEARAITETGTFKHATTRMIELYAVLLREGLILGEDEGISLNRPADAIEPLQMAFDLTDGAARQDPRDAASRGRAGTAGRELGNILRHTDPARALALYDAAIGRLAEMPNNIKSQRDRAMTLVESSYALRTLHRRTEARQRIGQALAILATTKDLPADRIALDSSACTVLRAQVDDLDEQDDIPQALALSIELLDKILRAGPRADTDLHDAVLLSRIYQMAARVADRSGDAVRARALAARRLDLWRAWNQRVPDNPFVRRQLAF